MDLEEKETISTCVVRIASTRSLPLCSKHSVCAGTQCILAAVRRTKMRACACACVRACVRVRACACVCVRVRVHFRSTKRLAFLQNSTPAAATSQCELGKPGPEVHAVQWIDLRDAVRFTLSSMSRNVIHINDWQKEEFEKLGVKRRDPMFITGVS